MISFTLLSLAAHLSSAQSAGGSPAVPRTECLIRMHAWCFTGVYGSIELSDDGQQRRWSITDRIDMRDGPLLIIEDKACDGLRHATPRKIDERRIEPRGSSPYVSIRYSLSDRGDCTLEFRLPTNQGVLDPIYRYFMLHRIFTNDPEIVSLPD